MVDRLLPAETVCKLPAGTVVYTKDKNGNIQTFGDDDGKQIDCPLVVLVDENSASADVYKRQLYSHMCIISFVETTHWPIAKW